MGIFQDKIQVRQKQMDEIWLNLCSHELKLALVNINDKLKELEKSKDLDTEISRLFYQVCDLFIRHKTELKMNKIVKLQILSLMFFWANQQKFFGIGKLFKSLSRQFVLNNIHEEYTITEINDLYIYAYFDESDLTTDLAIKDRFKYHHQGPLDVVSEVLRMSKNTKVKLRPQKISLYYVKNKPEILKKLIDPQYKFNHIYQDTQFMMKYLINTYCSKLTQNDIEII